MKAITSTWNLMLQRWTYKSVGIFKNINIIYVLFIHYTLVYLLKYVLIMFMEIHMIYTNTHIWKYIVIILFQILIKIVFINAGI